MSNIILIGIAKLSSKLISPFELPYSANADDAFQTPHTSPLLSNVLVVWQSDKFLLLYLISISLIMNEGEHLFICLLAVCIPFWNVFSYPLPFILLGYSFFSYSFLWVLCKLKKFALWFILHMFLPGLSFFFSLIYLYLFISVFLFAIQRSF